MYEAYWQFTRKPFDRAGDGEAYYPAEVHEAALLKLRYAVESRTGAALLIGGGGTGKTLLVQMLRRQLSEEYRPFAHLVFPRLDADDLLAWLADELGAPATAGPSLRDTLARLRTFLQENAQAGRHAVVAIDEAHLLDDTRGLEALRLLLNLEHEGRPVLTLLLVGQPTLWPTVERMPQLEERLGMKCVLRPLSRDETANYVRHRLTAAGSSRAVFDATALDTLFAESQGVPRRVNRLCDLALLVGFAEEHSAISREQVEAVSQELTVAAD
jgi:general secretion pathway protein A